MVFQKQTSEMYSKEGVLKKFAKYTGKHLYLNLYKPATVLIRYSEPRCLSDNFAKFLRTSFFIERLWWYGCFWHLLVNLSNQSTSVTLQTRKKFDETNICASLTNFIPPISFYTPGKHQKSKVF